MDTSLVAVPAIVGVVSEGLGLINKHYSNKIPPSMVSLVVECVKFGWSLVNGNYFKEKDERRQKQKAELLANEVKNFYLELMKNQQAQGTADEQKAIELLKQEHNTRLRELEVRLNISPPQI